MIDFEKEFNTIWFEKKFEERFHHSAIDFANVRSVAKYFYELGLKSIKEK